MCNLRDTWYHSFLLACSPRALRVASWHSPHFSLTFYWSRGNLSIHLRLGHCLSLLNQRRIKGQLFTMLREYLVLPRLKHPLVFNRSHLGEYVPQAVGGGLKVPSSTTFKMEFKPIAEPRSSSYIEKRLGSGKIPSPVLSGVEVMPTIFN